MHFPLTRRGNYGPPGVILNYSSFWGIVYGQETGRSPRILAVPNSSCDHMRQKIKRASTIPIHHANQASQPLNPAAPLTLGLSTNSTDLMSPGSDTITYSEYPPGTHSRYISNLAKRQCWFRCLETTGRMYGLVLPKVSETNIYATASYPI